MGINKITPSLQTQINLIEKVCLGNGMVNDFGFGPIWDMNVLDRLKPVYCWLQEGDMRIQKTDRAKVGIQSFSLYCMDRIQKGENNYIEILSDTRYILETIMISIDQDPYFVDLGILLDISDVMFEPQYEKTDLNVAGHMATFSLQYAIHFTPCNIPINLT